MHTDRWALVVEDEAHSLLAITALLSELQIGYKRNTSGKAVVQQARLMCPKLHFILLDTTLPCGDPYAICRSLRIESRTARIPVLALMDEYEAGALAQLRAGGFAGCLPKPIPRKHFAAFLERILSGGQLWEESV